MLRPAPEVSASTPHHATRALDDRRGSPGRVVRPRSVTEVQSLVRSCPAGIRLAPISTGNNWGYGRAGHLVPDTWLVDLSGLDGIVDYDPRLGLVTLEPGVTQERLASFLLERGDAFRTPTTGAGPSCSVLANALERGFGLTPPGDHAGQVVALEVVAADGTIHRGVHDELGARQTARAFPWDLGPDLRGLYFQHTGGIVTKATLRLAPQPESLTGFWIWIDDPDPGAAVEAIRTLRMTLGDIAAPINLMSQTRVLAMMTEPGGCEPLGPRLGARLGISPWIGMGVLEGPPEVVRAARRVVKRCLRGVAHRLVFMDRRRIERWLAVAKALRWQAAATRLSAMHDALELYAGRPSARAHGLLRWCPGLSDRRRRALEDGEDPSAAGVGLHWYAPAMPADGALVSRLLRALQAESPDPLMITLSSVHPGVIEATVPLMFDATDPAAARRAGALWSRLVRVGLEHEVAPYRVGPRLGAELLAGAPRSAALIDRVSRALDPEQRFVPRLDWSPGRPRAVSA